MINFVACLANWICEHVTRGEEQKEQKIPVRDAKTLLAFGTIEGNNQLFLASPG